jgi:hypothetical protein
MLQHRFNIKQWKQVKNDAKAWHVQKHFHSELGVCEIAKEKPLTFFMHSHLKSWDFFKSNVLFQVRPTFGVPNIIWIELSSFNHWKNLERDYNKTSSHVQKNKIPPYKMFKNLKQKSPKCFQVHVHVLHIQSAIWRTKTYPDWKFDITLEKYFQLL